MSWQKILSAGCRSVSELLTLVDLPQDYGDKLAELEFSTRITQRFISKITKGDPGDPLLKQILATSDELLEVIGFSKDPLQETLKNPMPGLLHKYHGRVLLTLTGACAINCRYCFRRHFSYNDNKLPRSNWHLLINYINNHPAIHEVILSGGDPLLVTNDYFKDFINELTKIPHLKTLRIHSRVPVVLPERIDDEWLAIMEKIKLNKVLVLHTNHPNEWDNDIHLICDKMHEAKITLLNQSVLLGGVNDNSDILIKLSHTLFASKVLPYYLHVLDPVKGAQHFTVKDAEIKKIYKQIQSSLPGYLVPKLVQEIANKKNKMLYNT